MPRRWVFMVVLVALWLAAPAARADKILVCTSGQPFERFSATLKGYAREGWFSEVTDFFFRDNYALIGSDMVYIGHSLADLTCVGFVNRVPTAIARINLVQKGEASFMYSPRSMPNPATSSLERAAIAGLAR